MFFVAPKGLRENNSVRKFATTMALGTSHCLIYRLNTKKRRIIRFLFRGTDEAERGFGEEAFSVECKLLCN